LAAGVVFRAVLEERLRRLCEQHSITLGKTKPTLNDYNSELYKSSVYDKITFKEVDTLIAIGNDAAHNNPTLVIERISLMRDGVTRILQKLST
jgi:DNA-binding MarR family transcriptional regulator